MRFTRRAIWTLTIAAFLGVGVLWRRAAVAVPRARSALALDASGMERARVPPVIIIPASGLRLRERGSGRELWPGSL